MENIVTIDFDIIMAPSIEIYNKEIQGGLTYEDYAFKNIINPIVDFNIYKKLTNYILECKKNNIKIFFISSHEEIYKYIKNLKEINLINIDHHHDFGYKNNFNYLNRITCGNWVRYCFNKNIIKTYLWINDDNSKDLHFKSYESIFITHKNIKEINFNKDIIPKTE